MDPHLIAKKEEEDVLESKKAILKQIAVQKIPTDRDVLQLYLSHKRLLSVMPLNCYFNLRTLWLNNNRLSSLNFLRGCERLSELYLHDNCINYLDYDIMKHLSLKTLSLQRNQLKNLENVLRCLVHMTCLQRLNLSYTPISQEKEYRYYVIYKIPSLQILDQHEISAEESFRAIKICDQERNLVQQKLAFGSRIGDFCPINTLLYPEAAQDHRPVHPDIGNNFYRLNPIFPLLDQATESRRLKKSLVEFTRLDWSLLPRYQERRLAKSLSARNDFLDKGGKSSDRNKSLITLRNPELITLRIKS